MNKTLSNSRTIRLVIANASEGDAKFLAAVVALFTDPANERMLARVREGMSGIYYDVKRGATEQPSFLKN